MALLAAAVWAGGSASVTAAPRARAVAITFDDLPYATEHAEAPEARRAAAIAAQRRIVGRLRRERIPAIGFVNEEKVQALAPIGTRLLAAWNQGLLTLGNHGYGHLDSNRLGIAEIEREVVNGEATIRPMAAAAGRGLRFFRFPFNHLGDTDARRVAIEALLARRGYTIAASTIDTSDYVFNRAYERALAAHDPHMRRRIERAYLDYSRAEIAYYEALDRQVLGRDVPAIIVLHANRLNAATIGPLLRLFRVRGYRFVSLAQAQSDPAYAAMPAVATSFGPMWGYRWAQERHLKVNGRLEQDPPAWVRAYGAGR